MDFQAGMDFYGGIQAYGETEKTRQQYKSYMDSEFKN